MRLVSDNEFSPAGLKVLLVDDDSCCLALLERMLRDCRYEVRSCNRASKALCMLRDKTEEPFDLVISDVQMPDMDGYKLLELIGLEMDLPVIMMSVNSDTNAVMKGIIYGACDYLIKPVRIEELRNIWQHVLRKRKEPGDFVKDSSEEWDDFVDADIHTHKRKRSRDEQPLRNISNMKKARVVWSFELHQQFVRAIDRIGIDKAVPKRILEVMNIQGLTRENVASHLQKYRLYLKRLSGVKPQPFPVASFQAYGVAPGGTMHIQKAVPTSRSSSGCFQTLDDGTLASLAQLQAIQQAAHRNSPAAGPLVQNTSPNARAAMHMETLTTSRTLVPVIQPSGHYDVDIGLGSAYEELNMPSDVASFLHTVFPQDG